MHLSKPGGSTRLTVSPLTQKCSAAREERDKSVRAKARIVRSHSASNGSGGHAPGHSTVTMDDEMIISGETGCFTKDRLVQRPSRNCRQRVQTRSLDKGVVNGNKARQFEHKGRDGPCVSAHQGPRRKRTHDRSMVAQPLVAQPCRAAGDRALGRHHREHVIET